MSKPRKPDCPPVDDLAKDPDRMRARVRLDSSDRKLYLRNNNDGGNPVAYEIGDIVTFYAHEQYDMILVFPEKSVSGTDLVDNEIGYMRRNSNDKVEVKVEICQDIEFVMIAIPEQDGRNRKPMPPRYVWGGDMSVAPEPPPTIRIPPD